MEQCSELFQTNNEYWLQTCARRRGGHWSSKVQSTLPSSQTVFFRPSLLSILLVTETTSSNSSLEQECRDGAVAIPSTLRQFLEDSSWCSSTVALQTAVRRFERSAMILLVNTKSLNEGYFVVNTNKGTTFPGEVKIVESDGMVNVKSMK